MTVATTDTPSIILASASPRRQEMLQIAGVSFQAIPADIDESVLPGETAKKHVERIAREKAKKIATEYPERVVLSADTIVVLQSMQGKNVVEEIFGKPTDVADAKRMLSKLQAQTHLVMTSFCIMRVSPAIERLKTCSTEVSFVPMDEGAITSYVETGEPMDKAGAYGIQGLGGLFIQDIQGSYSNVVGLPVAEVLSALRDLGLWTPSLLGLPDAQ